ncbi:reverse transcriptase domain-containing protein [Tanacetum coccineum]
MPTRSSSKFIGEPSTNPTSTILKRRNRRRSRQRVEPFSLVDTTVITSTLKYKDVPETSIKRMLFPFSIDGPTRIWLDKEPPRSILTWDDIVSKFINHFFPPSKTTLSEACDRFKDLLRACPHHGFTQLHQLDTFYNGLNPSDQDSLNSAAGGNLLERSAQDVLKIIENKSKVCNSRNKLIVSQVKASNVDSSEIASVVASAVTSAMTAMFKQHQVTPAPASSKLLRNHVLLVAVLILTDSVLPPMATLFWAIKTIFKDMFQQPQSLYFLGKPFCWTGRSFDDVYGEELTLRHDDEAVTFKVGQTSRYFYNDAESINRIDVIDVACGEYAQEVLGFLEISTRVRDIRLLEEFLNDDPSSPLPPQELRFVEPKTEKSSIDDPPELELKDLPSHLEYAFLEGTDKLPVIIAKDLKEDEKVRLLKVLKSHKRAIAWKISDIKGIDPQFCTHKILMEDDSKPAIQHQRRVNPKIHEVIKKEVIKLLDAGLIYPISDSPWVSPVHCVPKKGDITLNDATRKDHFPLPFMDQMLERLAGNEYYCFLDGFSGYFQIPIDPQDQEKTTFTCPYGTFAYRRMPFGLCNAPGREMPKALLLAWEKFFELKHAFKEKQHQPEDIQELLHKLLKDLQMIRDEHLNTTPETESDELIKSSVENLVPIPSESEDFPDIESECDVPVCDNFTTFSNPLFDADDDFSSSDNESYSDEDVPKKIYSNPLFNEEIIFTKIDSHHFNVESDLIESLLNRDILIVSSPKFDSLLEEFSGELAHIDLISPEIDEADFDPEEEICFVKKLIDSLMEEIDIFLALDDSIPPGIKNDDYDSEGDILFLEELLSNDPLSLPRNELFHFDRYYVPSSPRATEKPPDDDDVYFDIEPDTGVFTKVVDDISDNSTRELYVYVPNVLPTLPNLSPMIAPDYEASHARGFVLRSLEFQSLA